MPERDGARRVLVTGIPGVGKSTIARLVAEGLPRSALIEADVVRESIVGGFIAPDLSFPDDWVQQIRLQREIVNYWIDRMVEAGYHAIVDDVPIPPFPHFQNHYADLIADQTSVQVLLTASREVTRSRILARGGPFDHLIAANHDEVYSGFEEALGLDAWSDWTVIDTSDLQPDEVAALILGQL